MRDAKAFTAGGNVFLFLHGTVGFQIPDDELSRRLSIAMAVTERRGYLLTWFFAAPHDSELQALTDERVSFDSRGDHGCEYHPARRRHGYEFPAVTNAPVQPQRRLRRKGLFDRTAATGLAPPRRQAECRREHPQPAPGSGSAGRRSGCPPTSAYASPSRRDDAESAGKRARISQAEAIGLILPSLCALAAIPTALLLCARHSLIKSLKSTPRRCNAGNPCAGRWTDLPRQRLRSKR